MIEEIEGTASGEGLVEWTPPMIECDELSLRIIVRDRAGNRATRLAPTRLRLLNPRANRADLIARHHRRALVLADRGDRRSIELAREELAVILKVSPEDSAAWHDRGVIETRLGDHDAALVAYERALDLRPGDLRLTFSVVQGHINRHRSSLQPSDERLDAARVVFRGIDKVRIYEDPDFRELLERYRLLEEGLK